MYIPLVSGRFRVYPGLPDDVLVVVPRWWLPDKSSQLLDLEND
jgi:hypothetical protein